MHNRVYRSGKAAPRVHARARPCVVHVYALHKAFKTQRKTVLTSPDDATFECLTSLRRPDVSSFQELLALDARKEQKHRNDILVGDMVVKESGPLAGFGHVLDTAARRVLPGHLLRRCRILSNVQLGGTCLQRVALTACSGEESIFNWKLVSVGEPEQRQWRESQGMSADDAVVSTWLLKSVSRDSGADEADLPLRPHPRAAPEAIIQAQLAALRQGDIMNAAGFNVWGCTPTGRPWEQQLAAYRTLLRQPSHHLLLTHYSYSIQASALPSQRTFVAEVNLIPQTTAVQQALASASPDDASADSVHQRSSFVWELGMRASGWYVEAVRAVP